MGKNAYEDQGGIQVFIIFLHKVAVVLVGFTLEFIVEFDAGAAGGSKEVRKERWQCFKHGILQTGEEKHGQQKSRDGGTSIVHTLLDLWPRPPWCATRSREGESRLDRLQETGEVKSEQR